MAAELLPDEVVGADRAVHPCSPGKAQRRQTAFGRQNVCGRYSIRVT